MTREEKKYRAAPMAQLRLQQQFDRIDFVEDVLKPEVEALKLTLQFGLSVPEITIEIEVGQ